MYKKYLVNFLNNHQGLQVVLSILPSFLIVFYIVIYMQDLGSIYTIINHNDNIIEYELIDDTLKQVVSYNETQDGKANVTVKGKDNIEVEVKEGDLVFQLYVVQDGWFKIYANEKEIWGIDTDIITKMDKLDDDKFKIYVNDQSFEVYRNDLIAEVYIDEDGSFKLVYPDESIEPIKADYLSNMELVLKNAETYKYNIVSSYSSNIDSLDVNFVTTLPTDDMYFSESRYCLVKNISSDFAKNFILGSNILVTMFSMITYCLLLYFVKKDGQLKVMSRQEPLVMNICFIFLLMLVIPLTSLMLG